MKNNKHFFTDPVLFASGWYSVHKDDAPHPYVYNSCQVCQLGVVVSFILHHLSESEINLMNAS